MELGLYSFGDVLHDPTPGAPGRRLDALVRQARQADAAGVDLFALGEHHRPDFSISAPEIVLANIAATTHRIHLTTAVTVLSTTDPVRVIEQFNTLDLLSHGRAEITVGRGAFPESFPLFGYDLTDYEALFDEKLRLLIQLRDDPTQNWQGHFRPPLQDVYIGPRPQQERVPIWIGVGGTPQSVVRAAVLGQPMFLSLFTGASGGIRLVELYRRAAESVGGDPGGLPLATGGHMFIGRTSQEAREEFFGYFARYFSVHPSFPNGMPRAVYDQWVAAGLLVGSPQQVTEGILSHHELLGSDRFVGQFDPGVPAEVADRSLDLFLSEVLPAVHAATDAEEQTATDAGEQTTVTAP